MRKQKPKQTGRALLQQIQQAKLTPPRKRPLHVHIALHPMSILVLLCTGVLLVSFTLNAVADSYLVTAVVPAPPLTAPAVQLSPPNGTITGSQTIAAGGTCPANSYVIVFDNNSFVGEAICSAEGTFGVGVTLVQGINQLRAQDYNITNAPGPSSNAVTITYVPGAPQLPDSKFTIGTVVVGQLVVTQADNGVPFQQGTKMVVSGRPTVTGVAPPLASVTVAVAGSPVCTTTANVLGYWSCTVQGVGAGTHSVNVSADASGATLTFPAFNVTVNSSYIPPLPPVPPLSVSSTYGYSVHNVGQTVSYSITLSGGQGPFAVMVSWGDGTSDVTMQMNDGTSDVSHRYGWVGAERAVDAVRILVIDTAGQATTLQFDTLLRNPAFHSAIANITKNSGLWGVFEGIRPWLWVAWPGYW